MMSNNDSTIISTEWWFIPCDILLVLCPGIASLLALILLCIMIRDKTCHTVSLMLVANSLLAEFFFATVVLSMAIFMLWNDFYQIQGPDPSCIFRGYMGYSVTFLQNYSYLLQAMYRYTSVVYPTRIFWQSFRFQIRLIGMMWIFGFLLALPYPLHHDIKYDVENQICQIPMMLSVITMYNALFIYVIPISSVMMAYYKLVQHVREMHRQVTPANTLNRAQRELQMIRRIVILVTAIFILGFPYTLCVFISFFTTPPRYNFRIAYIFVNATVAVVVITLFQFTEPLKASMRRRIMRTTNRIVPTIT